VLHQFLRLAAEELVGLGAAEAVSLTTSAIWCRYTVRVTLLLI
jgi:hypothetical protein